MELNTFTKLLTAMSLSLALSSCGSEESTARVVIGVGDVIFSPTESQYQFPAVVQVAGLDGSPQANTLVTISVKTLTYTKGFQTFTREIDTPPVAPADQWEVTAANSLTCPAEDANNNGILDGTEDAGATGNGNGRLDPNTPTITSHPTELPTLTPGTATLITDNNGFGYFSLSYPKSESPWVTVEISATTQDGLIENRGIEQFSLRQAVDDVGDGAAPPAGIVSPYGTTVATCTDPA